MTYNEMKRDTDFFFPFHFRQRMQAAPQSHPQQRTASEETALHRFLWLVLICLWFLHFHPQVGLSCDSKNSPHVVKYCVK